MRRPVDVMAAEGVANPRQAVWDALRKMAGDELDQPVGLADLSTRSGVQRKTTRDYLGCLQAAGYVKHDPESDRWQIVRDAGVHAPRLRRDGTVVTQGAGTQNLWRSMRMLKKFTAIELAAHSTTDTVQVSENTAQSYCSTLFATGFLVVVQKANPQMDRRAIYRLVRDDGPKPPMIQRIKAVYDPNTGKVYQKVVGNGA